MYPLTMTLIETPPYAIDFSRFAPQEQTEKNHSHVLHGIRALYSKVIAITSLIFTALVEATCSTVKNLDRSFKHIVLGSYGRYYQVNISPALMIFRLIIWIGNVAVMFILTAIRTLSKGPQQVSLILINRLPEGMDPYHLRSKEQFLDASTVPDSIQVSHIGALLDCVNFTDANRPGYMASSARKEDNHTYSVAQLKEGLATLIHHVSNRVAFTGTPPAYDTTRLLDFYDQIESAIRLCLGRLEQEKEEFIKLHGSDVSQYNPSTLRLYKDLLEARARFAIDMAIAGMHCGSRYMGEAMTSYSTIVKKNASEQGSLQDELIEELAQARLQIANRHIENHLAPNYTGQSTHAYTEYMHALGGLLGIPGSAHVIEHLSQGMDRDHYLRLFFEEYTINFIIETIQNKVCKSQPFREKICTWLKVEAQDWDRQVHESQALELFHEIENIINSHVQGSGLSDDIMIALELITYCKSCNLSIPSSDGFVAIEELFTLEPAKAWLEKKVPKQESGSTLARRRAVQQRKHQVIVAFNAPLLRDSLRKQLERIFCTEHTGPIVIGDDLRREFEKIRTIEAIQTCFSKKHLGQPDMDVICRCLNDPTRLKEVILGALNRRREQDFLDKLEIGSMDSNGLPEKILEWLLVSHKIFLPQIAY